MEYREFTQHPFNLDPDGMTFIVHSGSTLSQLAHELDRLEVIDKSAYLVWLGRLRGDAHKIKAGEYVLEHNILPEAFLDKLVNGKVKLHTFTLIEGWTFKQLMKSLRQLDTIKHTSVSQTPAQIMKMLGNEDMHPEGWFFPETYSFHRGTSDIQLLGRMKNTMENFLEHQWQQRVEGLPLETPYEALILASIVERETALVEERGRIAGVFINRIRKRMRLQTDPTVIYGMGENFNGNIRSRDLRRDTPYNTYTRFGLPPTPIAMPSGEAIKAVLNPQSGSDLYFVARGDGSHQFSETLKAHNQAVVKYQLKGKQKPFSSSQTGSPDSAQKAGEKN